MGATSLIRSLEAIQISETAPELRGMLERIAEAGELPDYSDLAPMPAVRGHNLISNLDRIGRDRSADTDFALTMYLAALVKIVGAQQQRIDALEEKLGSTEPSRPQKKAS